MRRDLKVAVRAIRDDETRRAFELLADDGASLASLSQRVSDLEDKSDVAQEPPSKGYAQVVTVGASGADFTTIQEAIDSISGASSTNRYLVWIQPGLYEEQITMQDWVDLRGVSKHQVQLTFTGNNNGTVILADWCQIEDVIIELSSVSTEWAIVGNDVSNWHIRNVDILAASGSTVAQGIKISGDNWATGFIESSVINYVGTTGRGILIQGNATTPQMADCHMNDVFVDSLNATTGGAIEVIDCRDVYLSSSLVRTNPTQAGTYALKTSRAGASTTTYVRVNGTSLEGTNANALVISASTTVYWYNSSAESSSVSGTFTTWGHITPEDIGCECSATADQAIATSTWTSINLDEEKFDRGGLHDTSTNNTRITITVPGRYYIHGAVQFEPNATGLRFVRLIKNGDTSNPFCSQGPLPGDGTLATRVQVCALESLAAGDYIEMQAWQNSGGNLNSQFPNDYAPRFGAAMIR